MNKKLLLTLTATALLTACAGVTDVIPIGKDTYMIASRGVMGWSSSQEEKALAFQKAGKYCNSLGKELQPVNTNETAGGYGRIASAEVQFRCLNKDDPEFSRPTMQKAPDTLIQVK